MTAVKVSISLSEEQLAWAKKRAKRLKTSLSAVLSEAIREQERMEAGREVLAWLEEVHPPATAAELEEITREWKD